MKYSADNGMNGLWHLADALATLVGFAPVTNSKITIRELRLLVLLGYTRHSQPRTPLLRLVASGIGNAATVARSTGKLQAMGFVARDRVEPDRRSVLVRLTPAGSDLCDLLNTAILATPGVTL